MACTEALSGDGPALMGRLAGFLRLEPFDFGPAVAKGKFNAASNRGYDRVTGWAAAAESDAARPRMPAPLETTLRTFYSPFNERLFELTGARCQWPTRSS